ncbi:hypothetical protein [Methylobacterium haplocladii]|uniref:Uncharacterized protein n=1 Tax=Methylobacterium haplocladii TaxID=1176176 RepID=A0A512IL27_9HYPH|nr:hypothetical protein [Methylobacterium haplocladii]GEO98401.1 hypothetical protein MHA02_07890 [Methylobacterium haplocladii]GJD83029.1 hypothetical protein HPGCJGGD_0891 [Methylobacterium haplocladii]GLS59126.1 hypothetical protein GCM10007887_17920 [Methylobacterium haplocladii]
MNDKLMKTVIGAIVAVGLAIAVSYGLISQQTADKVQTQTNEALSGNQSGQTTAPQQPAPAPQSPTTQAPAPNAPAPQNPAPRP